MTTEQLVYDWFQRVWNQGDLSFVDERLADPCEIVGLQPEPIRSRDEFRQLHSVLTSALDNIDVTVDQLVSSGETFAGIVTMKAVHRRTGIPFQVQSGFSGRLANGKIVEASNVVDFLPLLTAIESVPMNALAEALA